MNYMNRWNVVDYKILGDVKFMIKNILRNKSSIIFTWSLSFIAVLFIPIFINIAIYFNSERIAKDEINRSNLYALEQLGKNIDSVFDDVERMNTDIVFNESIHNFSKITNSLTSANQYEANKLIKYLNTYNLVYKKISFVYIYFPNINMVITPTYIADSEDFYKNFCINDEMTYEEWKQTICNNHPNKHLMFHRKDNIGDRGKKTIAFTSTLPLNSSRKDAVIVIMVDEDSLLKEIEKDIMYDNWFFILDENNQTLLSNVSINLPKSLNYKRLTQERETIYDYFIEQEQTVVSYITSVEKNYKYILITPTKIFWEKLYKIRILMVISIFACVFSGAIIIFLSIKRNYKPIDRIINVLKSQIGNKIDNNNEYKFIETAVETELNERQKLIHRVQQQNNLIKDSVLSRLLKGRLDGKISIQDSLSSFGIEFVSSHFAVMAFKVEDFNLLFPENSDLNFTKRVSLTKMIMTNIIEELIREKNEGFMTEMDDMMICIVNFRESELENWKQELLKVVKESQVLIKKHFNINYTVGISSVYNTIEGISQGFQDALYVMEYKLNMGIEETVFYNDIEETDQTIYYYPFNEENKLVNFLKVGDFENSKLLIEEIIKKNLYDKKVSHKVVKYLVFNLVSTVLRAINELNSSSGINDYEQYISQLEQLIDYDHINTMCNELIDIIKNICDHVKRDSKENNNIIIKDVENFIHNNYQNPNLSITLIGEYLNLTPYYVSKLYKENMCESMQDYINRYRIEKAKELLEAKNITIEAVAQNVGYSNLRTFTRLFKKQEGIPPGKYRKL